MSINECPLFKQWFETFRLLWDRRIERVSGDTDAVYALLLKAKSSAESASIKHYEAAQGRVNTTGYLVGMHHTRPETEEDRSRVWDAIAKVYEKKILEHRVRSAVLSASAPEWTPSAQ